MSEITYHERDEGQWWAYRGAEMQGPYPSAEVARYQHTFERFLCDDCYEAVCHDLACCQDECSLSLDHDGLCAPRYRQGRQVRCDHCGRRDRLTEVNADDIDLDDLP